MHEQQTDIIDRQRAKIISFFTVFAYMYVYTRALNTREVFVVQAMDLPFYASNHDSSIAAGIHVLPCIYSLPQCF